MVRFIAGFVTALVVGALAVVVAVKFGLVPAAADVPPPAMERMMAKMSLAATIDREAPQPPYPFPSSDAAIIAGSKLYTQNCAMCHGSGSGSAPIVAKGFYIHAPQFAKHDVSDDPEGETYWKIENGIRFTAMPSYKGALTEEQIWQLTYFMKNLPDHLPAEAQTQWRKPIADAR